MKVQLLAMLVVSTVLLSGCQGYGTHQSMMGVSRQMTHNIQISGAFGMSLGQLFDPDDAIAVATDDDGATYYQFSPVNPYSNFDNYFVAITPISHQVYYIGMTTDELQFAADDLRFAADQLRNSNNPDACQSVAVELSLALVEKYGPYTTRSSIGPMWIDTAANRSITVNCRNRGAMMQMFDETLIEQALIEKAQLEPKPDPSGL
jgi:hypothetical protein